MVINKVEKAKEIAVRVHGHQTDKLNVPYFFHLEDVSKRVAHLGMDYEVVGLLHDVVEDVIPEQQASIENEIQKL